MNGTHEVVKNDSDYEIKFELPINRDKLYNFIMSDCQCFKSLNFSYISPILYLFIQLLLVLTLVGSVQNLTQVVEIVPLLIGMLLLPWLIRRHYYFATQDPKWLTWVFWLSLMLITPRFLGIQISIRHFISTVLLLLYGLPLLRSHKTVGYTSFIILILGVANYFFPLSYLLVERCRLSREIWIVLIQTNRGEMIEFLASHQWYLGLIPVIIVFIVLFYVSRRVRAGLPRRRVISLFSCLFLASMSTGAGKDLIQANEGYQIEMKRWKRMAKQRAKGLPGNPYSACLGDEPRKIMIIIGESTTRRHMSLYGYPQKTTPGLEIIKKEGELFVFDNVISPHTLTMQSLEKVLTTSNNENKQSFAISPSVIDIFHKAGFHTKWISNQNRAGVYDNQVSILASTADSVRFSSGRIGADWEAEPDGVLLPIIERSLPSCNPNSLVFVHLMGAHFKYGRRVPVNCQNSIQNRELTLNSYDMAINYCDFVLTSMIQMAKKAGFDTIVFFSDHGEVPHEARHHSPGRYVPEMVEIPFFIWLSPEFQKSHKKMVMQLEKYLHRPYMNDDFIHTIIDISKINTSVFDPTRSIINMNFKSRPRWVLDATIKYEPDLGFHSQDGLILQ